MPAGMPTNPYYLKAAFHIQTSRLICSAGQTTVFDMKRHIELK